VVSADNAVEMMLAGADLIGVGTALFDNPYAPIEIISGLEKYLDDNNIDAVVSLKGKVELN